MAVVEWLKRQPASRGCILPRIMANAFNSFPELKQVADHLFVIHDDMQINARYRDIAMTSCGPDLGK